MNFTVEEGETLESLSERLEVEGIIVNAGVFRWYVEDKGGLELTPGYYQLRPNDHIGNIMGTLRTPPAQTYTKVTFPEGFTIAQMATRLEESGERMTAAEFLTAATDPAVVSSLRPPGRDLTRRAPVPRHVPGLEQRERGPGRRAAWSS